ncbi:TonB-dependent receptor [Novosphingobium flavum]|uniref:TonB-dependent receptor n=1 Tax=Novosphingobium flavum TaxID=1778672 RepID=A0A7X1FTX3_9SPHN|nr:TonB-dependent receptor [Novosphingobium flavum]MBC2666277.1 TonB-dependent receptor [Novosphingobium flavum]
MNRGQSRAAAWLVGASALVMAVPALAQTSAPTGGNGGEDIVVTGSRVISNGNNSPTPLTVVSAQDVLATQPTTISDALNTLPVFSGPRTQVSNPNAGIGAGGGGNAVANQLNLRNLGAQRTLILLDGKRVAPTTSNGIVDVDTVPQFILKRVDVVTGGVSAVYGSDAVSGVVNFVTDKDFSGVRANVQAGISSRGDGRQVEAGLAWGGDLGDRAHLIASYEYRDDEGILYRSSRPKTWQTVLAGNGSAGAPFFVASNGVRADYTFGGVIRPFTGTANNSLVGKQFTAGGVLIPFVPGTTTSAPALQLGGDGAAYDGSLKAPLRSHQIFARLDYEVSDAVHFYVEGAANFKRNVYYSSWQQITNLTISKGNAFLSDAVKTAMGADTQFSMSKFIGQAPRLTSAIDERQIFVNAGLDGKLGQNWNWGLGFVYSNAKLSNTEGANLNTRRLLAALDAVKDGSGNTVCNVTLTNPGLYPGCVALNPFGQGSESAAAIAYILGDTHFTAWTDQTDVSGSVSGNLFETGAGPVKVALSGEWRRQAYKAVSDALPSDTGNCTGLRFNCNANTVQWFQTFANRSRVSQTVEEGAVEVEVPLLKDSPFADSLSLNGAARYTHYNTSGKYWTWKLGLDWHLTDALRFRATRSRDIRAPTLEDLFAPAVTTPAGGTTDLLVVPNITSTAATVSQGNPSLTAEVGETTTVGMVWKPVFAPGLSMSLDYFGIRVKNAILTINGTNQTFQQVCYQSQGASPYCALQDRPLGYVNNTAANAATLWRTQTVNVADIKTWGFDFETNYAARLGAMPISLRGLVTWQPHIRYVQPGLPTFEMGGVAYGQNGLQASPQWRVTGIVNFAPTEHLAVTVLERWRSGLGLTADPTQFAAGPNVPSYATTNLTVAWKVPSGGKEFEFYVNVQNLFDNLAPGANFGGTQGSPGLFGGFPIGDDPVGRYFSAGARLKF